MTATEIKNCATIQNSTNGIKVNGDLFTSTSISSSQAYPITMPDLYCEYTAEKRKREEAENVVAEQKKELKELREKKNPDVKRILKNGDYMTVLWDDGTKTIVKRAEDEPESDYAAFTAALGIRCYGSNSALKKLVASAEWQHKKKQKKEEK